MIAYIRKVKSKSRPGRFRYYPILNGKHVGGGYWKKRQAEDALDNAITSLLGGGSPDKKTLGKWYEEWLPQVATRIKESTLESYEQGFRVHILPGLGWKIMREISVADLETWKAAKSEEVSGRTVNKILTILGTCIEDAFVQGEVDSNVVRKVRRAREESKEMSFLTPPEVRKLINAESEIRPMVATAILTGVRQGELLALRWGDVDLENRVLRIRRSCRKGRLSEPKTESSIRSVTIPLELCEILKPLKGPDDSLCFQKDGKPWSVNVLVRGYFHPLLDGLGIKRIRWHDLRHTYATIMLSPPVNCPMKWLQQQLGHTSIKTTMDLYGHLLSDAGDGTIQRFSNLLFGEDKPSEIEPPHIDGNEEEEDPEEPESSVS